jgi:acetate kinase
MDEAHWAAGYGVIRHTAEARARIRSLSTSLGVTPGDGVPLYDLLHALDRLTSAGMWLVVHETYARSVWVIPADEEAVLARDTWSIVGG